MKIWAKLITDNKIMKDIIYESDTLMKYSFYQEWIREICDKLDIPTPVIIPYHYKCFALYHNTKFKADDFIQSLGYDQLYIEDCKC